MGRRDDPPFVGGLGPLGLHFGEGGLLGFGHWRTASISDVGNVGADFRTSFFPDKADWKSGGSAAVCRVRKLVSGGSLKVGGGLVRKVGEEEVRETGTGN